MIFFFSAVFCFEILCFFSQRTKGEMNVLISRAAGEGSHQGYLDKANLGPHSPISSNVVLE